MGAEHSFLIRAAKTSPQGRAFAKGQGPKGMKVRRPKKKKQAYRKFTSYKDFGDTVTVEQLDREDDPILAHRRAGHRTYNCQSVCIVRMGSLSITLQKNSSISIEHPDLEDLEPCSLVETEDMCLPTLDELNIWANTINIRDHDVKVSGRAVIRFGVVEINTPGATIQGMF